MEFIRTHQLDMMLILSAICGFLALMTLLTESLSRKKKSILILMELSSMFLLIFDRLSYLYRGDLSGGGVLTVRVGNCMVFFLAIFIPHLVTQYLKDLYKNEGELPYIPLSLRICEVLFAAGTVLIVISQFTDLYYTIDSQNLYQRSPGFIISYIVPFLIVILQEATILKYRSRLSRGLVISMLICIILPIITAILQIFNYGLSLTNITVVFVVIIFYVYALKELNRAVETSRKNELRSYQEAERIESAMFEETAQALASAIDAKDRYTHGHSTRVAAISRMIAAEAGFSEKECDQLYFTALLHDVGKIGVPDEIINKEGKLTDEEFDRIKRHPILGYQILSSIKQSPYLSVGAHYHHERYDGRGYPDGLSGENIPATARIIAVADAFDAMSSSRSYRSSLTLDKTREEVEQGMGTQFDPEYARILLHLLDKHMLDGMYSGFKRFDYYN